MKTDDLILILAYFLFAIILILLVYLSKNKLKVFYINISILILYTVFFLYSYNKASATPWSRLDSWFFIFGAIIIHTVVNVICIIIKLVFRKRRLKK